MDIKPHTRRAPQPPIPAERIQPGTKWPKNRSIHVGQPPRYDVVDSVDLVNDASGAYYRVHYHDEETRRKGSMPLKAFCSYAEHREPDPDPPAVEPVQEEAPQSCERETGSVGVRDLTEEVAALNRRMASFEEMLGEALLLLRARAVNLHAQAPINLMTFGGQR